MRSRRFPGVWVAGLLIGCLSVGAAAGSDAAPAATAGSGAPVAGTIGASIVAIGTGGASVSLKLASGAATEQLPVKVAAEQKKLQHAAAGDEVQVVVDDVNTPRSITGVGKVCRPVDAWAVVLAMAVALVLLLGIACAVTHFRPQRFLVGVDNRYSNSQTQLALWFGAVATVYLATVGLRLAVLGWDFIGGVAITEHLLTLTGLSALTFGGAKVITTAKLDAAAQKGELPAKSAAIRPRLLTDLVQNDAGRADLGDFQMILVTLAAVGLFVLSALHGLGALELASTVTLPDVDSTMLSAFGLGQGAYLVKKAAVKAGEG